MKALVPERKDEPTLRDFPVEDKLGPRDVRVALRTIGARSTCTTAAHGAIGPFVVRPDDPRPARRRRDRRGRADVPSSSAWGLYGARHLDPASRAMAGKYNPRSAYGLGDAACARRAAAERRSSGRLTSGPPDHVSYAEGATGALAVGVHAATKVQVQPGDVAVVIGAGPIWDGDDLLRPSPPDARGSSSATSMPGRSWSLRASSVPCFPSMSGARTSRTSSGAKLTDGASTCCSNARAMGPPWPRCSISSRSRRKGRPGRHSSSPSPMT